MSFTDKDEEDLRAIVKQKKKSPISSFLKDSEEYSRQYGKNSQRAAAPAVEPENPEVPFHTGGKKRNPEAYKKGGKIDGVATRGKTRWKMY